MILLLFLSVVLLVLLLLQVLLKSSFTFYSSTFLQQDTFTFIQVVLGELLLILLKYKIKVIQSTLIIGDTFIMDHIYKKGIHCKDYLNLLIKIVSSCTSYLLTS